MTLYIVDIDGTLADDRARKRKAGPEPSRDDKPAYLAWLAWIQSEQTLAEDKPIPGMAALVQGLTADGLVIYLTAREDRYRDVTRRWLERHGFPRGLLLMRPDNSWLSSRDLKQAHIVELMSIYKTSHFVAIDDDGSGDCSAMYNELGIPHLHVRLPALPTLAEEGEAM